MSNEVYTCIGCGAEIQTENPTDIGFLPASALKKGLENEQFYCQRCFKLRHYNELSDLQVNDDVFLDKLSDIASDDAFIIHVVDIFDVEGSIISGLPRFIGNQPFVVVANKFDLLPKVTKVNRVKHWLTGVLRDNGLLPEEVLLVSATKRASLEPLIQLIEKAVRKQNVYIVGATNVGKSTLINQLIHHYGGEKEIITTSNFPGTTLDTIKIPLTENHAIIDTPGIVHRNQLAHYLTREEAQLVMPTKPLKPKTYQLKSGQTIFIGGVARFDYVKGDPAAFTFYVSKDAYLHRTKLEGATEFYAKHVGDLLNPPMLENVESFPALRPTTVHLKPDQDIAVSGLGWITTNQAAEVVIWVPKGVSLSIRSAII